MSIVNVDYYRQQSKQLEIILTVNNINSILALQLIVMYLTVLRRKNTYDFGDWSDAGAIGLTG